MSFVLDIRIFLLFIVNLYTAYFYLMLLCNALCSTSLNMYYDTRLTTQSRGMKFVRFFAATPYLSILHIPFSALEQALLWQLVCKHSRHEIHQIFCLDNKKTQSMRLGFYMRSGLTYLAAQ